jgi:hypothetical protein
MRLDPITPENRYEIYGHEYFTERAGLSAAKIATLVVGERPSDLVESRWLTA